MLTAFLAECLKEYSEWQKKSTKCTTKLEDLRSPSTQLFVPKVVECLHGIGNAVFLNTLNGTLISD